MRLRLRLFACMCVRACSLAGVLCLCVCVLVRACVVRACISCVPRWADARLVQQAGRVGEQRGGAGPQGSGGPLLRRRLISSSLPPGRRIPTRGGPPSASFFDPANQNQPRPLPDEKGGVVKEGLNRGNEGGLVRHS